METDFPVKVTLLPNKGRSFIATRAIQPQELVFVAEAFGTTMVEEKVRRTWMDSGARQQWKLKTEARRSSSEEVDVGVVGADTPLASSPSSSVAIAITATSTPQQHYSELIQQALAAADTKQRILQLNDTDLARFLDNTWSAFDGLIAEQESWIQYATTTTTTTSNNNSNNNQHDTPQHSHTQAQCEALFPKLAKLLLEGNNQATIAAKTSDDDCETIRLVSEVLYRRQLDLEEATSGTTTAVNGTKGGAQGRESTKAPATAPLTKEDGRLRGGQRATFEDYCAMQSNELVLFRQQVKADLDSQEDSDSDGEEQEEQELDVSQETQQQRHRSSRESKHETGITQWRKLLSIFPNHLFSCFYVYLRIRDAYLLLARENSSTTTSSTITPMPSNTQPQPVPPPSRRRQRPQITLTITSTLFRTILYREVANSFGIRDASDELLGFAVFPRACFFNHSCRPNILKKRRQGLGGGVAGHKSARARQMEYWSTRLIQEGEECCISYGDILAGVEERRARLEDMYFFLCSCPRCLEETREGEEEGE
ncbi:hypothetical protein BGZ95_003245 [Linnemannia exigua]|uniref:SET domain-containing protein n=1 Tax=Linnemannia exigua TaxID=604196 RepID=A0AAD4DI67_9FUNG|nr:hypothetical protein BGZ95_003245 [Linnemannia exigua]